MESNENYISEEERIRRNQLFWDEIKLNFIHLLRETHTSCGFKLTEENVRDVLDKNKNNIYAKLLNVLPNPVKTIMAAMKDDLNYGLQKSKE